MTVPADLLDLNNWALQLPTGEEGDPTEIFQPELSTFVLPPHFVLDPSGTGVLFQANAGGVTTAGSGYARTELREMTGAQRAAWSTTVGAHSLTITQAITHVPEVKPHVVAGQIHDGSDEVVAIRLEDTVLFVEKDGDPLVILDESYTLGEPFTVRLSASAGYVSVFFENLVVPVTRFPVEADTCFFKAGAYTQSNIEMGDTPDAYGEVRIYQLELTHW